MELHHSYGRAAREGLRVGDQVQSLRQGISAKLISGFDSALTGDSEKEADDNSDTGGRSAKRKRVESTESSAQSLAVQSVSCAGKL